METVLLVLLSVVGIFLLGFIVLLCFALYVTRRFFHRRYNGNKHLKYFHAADFQGLTADPVSFCSDQGQILRGFIYKSQNISSPLGLIVISHGFGAGHEAYTTEINTFAQAGFIVLAYDGTGCVRSDGKYFRGFDQGPIDLKYALQFADGDPRLSGLNKVLVGHSWGAFSVMNAQAEAENICGTVAMCGFICGADVVAQTAVSRFPFVMRLFARVLRVINRRVFRKNANKNSLLSLRAAKCPVLLLYGERDKTVLYRYNGEKIKKGTKGKANIQFYSYKDKGHNVYLTTEAEEYMNHTFGNISRKARKDPESAESLYNNVDYKKMTEEDPVVMEMIIDFCKKAVGQAKQ